MVTVRGIECLGRPVAEVVGPARVALRLGRHAPRGIGRGSPLVSPGAYADAAEVDVRLHGTGVLPARPMLHVGSAKVSVRARPLGERHARLRLAAPLPLRHGDRVVLRDPGSRTIWGADVLDAEPPALQRRGAARLRAVELDHLRPDVAGELDRRGVVRRSVLRRLGVALDRVPTGTVSHGDWLVSARQVDAWSEAIRAAASSSPDGVTAAEVARLTGVPDPELVPELVRAPVTTRGGRLVVDAGLPAELRTALDALRGQLAENPFRAPDAEGLAALGLDRPQVARLARDGQVLALADGVVLLPGADQAAYDVLAALPQPFTTSDARRALGTSRRVMLPLLAHLDRTRRTVRLPDDTRRVIRND
jgi:selenocysteine-specific elongation factor